ncbi:MAG: hypothetical protein ABIT71_17150 [Vicinamibacteraceae bacterium]
MARLVVQDSPPSPLYCRYHGFLLGQFLAIAFSDDGTIGYADRRVRLLAGLRELGVDVPIPESPDTRGGLTHAGVLTAVLPRLARQSRELAEFTILGGLVAHYAVAAGTGAAPAAALLLEIERLAATYDLPAIDPLRFATAPGERESDGLPSPALGYLGEIIARLPIEADTALVIMPIASPYTEHYAGFHRPALEHCGYRGLCAWGGLGGEASTELVLTLLPKVGFVWADVSEIDRGAVVAIGAAQALGKRTMIVAAEERAAGVPARIGGDAVIRYDPRSADWPHGPVLLMAACLAGITLAAERGDRLRFGPNSIEAAFDEVSQALGRILLPPDAREAHRRGRRAMDAGDLAVADRRVASPRRLPAGHLA